MKERLQKLMAQAGYGSRRSCETIIEAGRVTLNGRTAKLGDKAEIGSDTIKIDGQPLKPNQVADLIYIAVNKPKGVISSLKDELDQGRKTVRDLIDIPGHLYPVGRLDKQSTGLMLMTNDGDMAHRLTHPRYGHEKKYHVFVEGSVDFEHLREWEQGVWLEGQKTAPAKVRVVSHHKHVTKLEIILREGRKRQIRRVAAQLGYNVRQLERVQLGPIRLGQLKEGKWRHLYNDEVEALRKAVETQNTAGFKKKPQRRHKRSTHRPPKKQN